MAFRAEKPVSETGSNLVSVDVTAEDGKVVGTGRASIWKDTQTGAIERIVVSPDARRKGVGSIIAQALFGWLRVNGARTVIAEIVSETGDQTGTEQFYKNQGFEIDRGDGSNPPTGSRNL